MPYWFLLRALLKNRLDLQHYFGLTVVFWGVTVSGICHALPDSEKIIQDHCRGCHGINGRAKQESWPNLNCQNRGYLYARLLDLKREDDHDIDKSVQRLSLSEIDAIARYYANQPCK